MYFSKFYSILLGYHNFHIVLSLIFQNENFLREIIKKHK